LFVILGANMIMSVMVEATPELATYLTGGVIIALGIVLLGFGVLCFFVGRGLWNLKKWAKIIVLIFAILGIISIIWSMIRGFGWFQIVRLVVDAVIV